MPPCDAGREAMLAFWPEPLCARPQYRRQLRTTSNDMDNGRRTGREDKAEQSNTCVTYATTQLSCVTDQGGFPNSVQIIATLAFTAQGLWPQSPRSSASVWRSELQIRCLQKDALLGSMPALEQGPLTVAWNPVSSLTPVMKHTHDQALYECP